MAQQTSFKGKTDESAARTSMKSDVNAELKRICSGSKLFGRQVEREKLVHCWDRVCKERKQEIVVISGDAGSGKSAIAESLRPVINKEKPKSFFLTAKFVENRILRIVGPPFEIFETAFSRYVAELMDTKNEQLVDDCSHALSNAVKDDMTILQMIPALEPLLLRRGDLKSSDELPEVITGSKTRQQAAQFYSNDTTDQLKYAFENALAAICSITPLVLFLDDLQWANATSLEFLTTILQSEQHFGLLVLTTIRSESLRGMSEEPLPASNGLIVANTSIQHENSALCSTMKRLEEDESSRITNVDLSNLDLNDFQILVAETLNKKKEDVAEFARIAHNHTGGNIFHFFQLLRLLADQGEMVYRDGLWLWDESSMTDEADLISARSTVELVMRTIQTLPRPVQEALKVASCLGVELDCSAIDRVLQTPSAPLLQKAEDEGFLVFYPQNGGYSFAHDLIRQASYSLIPKDELRAFYLHVGRRLLNGSSQAALDENILMIASLLNAGSALVTEVRQRYKIAEVNLKAAKKALSIPSLSDSAVFLQIGIAHLAPGCWENRYQLSLDLFNNAAEVHCLIGDFECAHAYINQVVEHGACLQDKFQAYVALIKSMDAQEDPREALSVCIRVLRELGERFPSKASKLTVLKEFFLTRLALRGKSDNDIKTLKRMTNESKIRSMNFMNQGFVVSYMSKNPMASVFSFRSVRMTLKYGLHESSSVAFSVFAMTLTGLHIDEREGYRFGKLAMDLADSSNSPRHICFVNHLCGHGVIHWRNSYRTSLNALQHAHEVGMRTGNFGAALSAVAIVHSTRLLTGSNVSTVKIELARNVRLSRLHNFPKVYKIGLLLQQVISCHEGNEEDPSKPSGSIINLEEMISESMAMHDRGIAIMFYFYGAYLACFYNNYAEAKRMAILLEKLQDGPAPAFLISQFPFVYSLAAMNLYRSGIDKKQNLRIAKRQLRKVRRYAKNCPSNFLASQLLLEGELLAVKQRHSEDEVHALFDRAVTCAQEERNYVVIGMALEKHGDYLASLGKKAEAVALWTEAARAGFNEMGATAKTKQIRDRVIQCKGACEDHFE